MGRLETGLPHPTPNEKPGLSLVLECLALWDSSGRHTRASFDFALLTEWLVYHQPLFTFRQKKGTSRSCCCDWWRPFTSHQRSLYSKKKKKEHNFAPRPNLDKWHRCGWAASSFPRVIFPDVHWWGFPGLAPHLPEKVIPSFC